MVGAQCSVCGSLVGGWKKLSQVGDIEALAPWDQTIAETFRRAENARVKDYRAALVDERGVAGFAKAPEREPPNFWTKYSEYLASPEWAEKRRRVLDRADYRCEGCGERQATQVHHLTYARVGKEMLFDLVAVCDYCHDVIHGKAGPA